MIQLCEPLKMNLEIFGLEGIRIYLEQVVFVTKESILVVTFFSQYLLGWIQLRWSLRFIVAPQYANSCLQWQQIVVFSIRLKCS